MTDNQLDDLAMRYAEQALVDIADPAVAAGVLMQAGLAVTLRSYSPEAAEAAINSILSGIKTELRDLFGMGVIRQ